MAVRDLVPYLAVRALLARELQPYALAGYALACAVDDLVDGAGPLSRRTVELERWAERLLAAVATGRSSDPLLRAYAHAFAACGQRQVHLEEYLAGARTDLDFAGFTTEADYQEYIDRVTLPFLMVTAGLQYPGGGGGAVRARWRLVADSSQRLDFLADLSVDLRQGRLYLPTEDLERFGVARADLERARSTPGVRALLADACARTRATLTAARSVLAVATAGYSPLMAGVLGVQEQQLRAVERRGPGVLRRPLGAGLRHALLAMVQENRRTAEVGERADHSEIV